MNKSVKIYYTSDIHGYLFPTNYADKTEKELGLLKCIPNFLKDKNTLIIDGGDMLQGSALARYCQENLSEGFPQAIAMNAAKYDFVTIGNHDVNFGTDYLYDYLEQLDAHCLCENIADKQTGKKKYPWTIKQLANGLKVGLVGIVTDYINVWEKETNIQDISITDPFEAAKQAYEELKDQVDITICIYHGGFEKDVKTGKQLSTTNENIGYKICEELSFDILLTGHQHLLIEGQYLNDTYIVQPSFSGMNYFEINLEIDERNNKKEITSQIGFPNKIMNEKLCHQLQPLENKVQSWLDQSIGQLNEEALATDKLSMGLYGSPVVELIGAIQQKSSGTQLTVVSLANNSLGFHKEVTMRDIIATYPYTNQLITLEITGSQLKKVIEQNMNYFTLDNTISISPTYLYPKVEHYHYDFFVGVRYDVDLSKKVGERLLSLTYQGEAVQEEDRFTISLSDYRASGGGGFLTYQECPVLKEDAAEIIELLIAYIREEKEIIIPKNLTYTIQ